MHWKCQLLYTIIMFRKHPASWLVIKAPPSSILPFLGRTKTVSNSRNSNSNTKTPSSEIILQLSTYIHHNYHFRSECNDSFYFWSNFLCMSSRIRCWCTFRIRLDMAYILVAFYHHNNPLDSYSSISLQKKNVHYDMLCTAFPMNHCTSDTMNDTMHSYK